MIGAILMTLPAAILGVSLAARLIVAFDDIQDRRPRFRSAGWQVAALAFALTAGFVVAVCIPLAVLHLHPEATR